MRRRDSLRDMSMLRKTKMKAKHLVLVLLFVTVAAPIVFYSGRVGTFKASMSKIEFLEDLTTVSFSGDNRHLNVIPQESSAEHKEPIGIVYSDISNKSAQAKEHRTDRVLSATDNGDQSHPKNPIRQITDMEKNGTTVQERDTKVIQQASGQISKNNPQNMDIDHEKEHRNVRARTSGKVNEKEHRTVVNEKLSEKKSFPNARVRRLKDQLIRAKLYLSLPATKGNSHLVKEVRLRMKEVQRALGDASKDSELPKNANDKMEALEQSLSKGKQQVQDDCAAIVKKLRAMLHTTEEQLRVHKKQNMFLTQLTAKTLPKGLHCLPLSLTTEYYALDSSKQLFPNQEKLEDPKLAHYAIFSDNVLATSVVVNSTVTNAKHPSNHVFHIVTDKLNYAAMRMWFLANPPGKATIQVQNIEEFTWLNSSYSPVLKQLSSQSMVDYYFKTHQGNSDSSLKYRNPKYLSILNHLRFYLPEVFPKLNKVLFLDDDIVVQKDLSGLWSVDLKGNVNGAVETCGENFHRFDRYLNFSNPLISKNFDPRACGWAYGMNIFDLDEWKRQNITEDYHKWQELNHERQLWKLGTLPPGLITFWKRTFPINRWWHVLGLGYNPNVNQRDIERAAVIHYNGNMKPWLEIGILRYRNYWSKYVDYDHKYLRQCNINP